MAGWAQSTRHLCALKHTLLRFTTFLHGTEVTALTGLELAFGAPDGEGLGKVCQRGGRGQKAGVRSPGEARKAAVSS